jgi:hypothetical protein
MIYAIATGKDGRKILLLGVDDRNIERLTSGKPLHADGGLVGLPIDVVLLHGKTYQDVIEQIRKAGFDIPDYPGDPPVDAPQVIIKKGQGKA